MWHFRRIAARTGGVARRPRSRKGRARASRHVELRDQLRASGHRFSSECDTEVLLRAYEEWGVACLERLNGMFAFAIWDGDRQELFCARDRFGEKPFHYIVDKNADFFAFGSEIKSFVRAGLIRAAFDDRAVYRYLRFGEQAGAVQTIWKNVQRLPPAHFMRVRLRGGSVQLETHRYVADGLSAAYSPSLLHYYERPSRCSFLMSTATSAPIGERDVAGATKVGTVA